MMSEVNAVREGGEGGMKSDNLKRQKREKKAKHFCFFASNVPCFE
jgi:hypothetical protein